VARDVTHVVIYALGGGQGHAIRGSLVAASLVRLGFAVRLLVPARLAWLTPFRASHRPEVVPVPRTHDPAALRQVVERCLDGASMLLVDTFPEGLLDELQGIDVPRYALLRLRRDAGSMRFRRGLARCRAAIDLEPHLGWLHGLAVAQGAAPVRALRRHDEADVVLWGEAALEPFLGRLAQRLARRGLNVIHQARAPARLDDVVRAPIVVGAAGFNLSYELRAIGVRHHAVPLRRPFDDQRTRARALAQVARGPLELEQDIMASVGQLRESRDLIPTRLPAVRIDDGTSVARWLSRQELQRAV
jgi:hypothetical protein